MGKVKFKNIDCCKGIALFLVLIYHYWVLSGSPYLSVPGVNTIIPLGGEIGVTMFFILSGFGIYCLMKNEGILSWNSFIKSRFLKIAPLYYISIILVISLTSSGAAFFSKSGLVDVVMHILFIHNLLGRFHGSINGALWTMGVIFQYYFVALFLFKCIEKNRHITLVVSIIFTVVMKMITYGYILPKLGMSGTLYFVYGRQLFTALDNFVIGMYIGSFIYNNKKRISSVKAIICLIVMICLLVLWGKFGLIQGVYVDNLGGYLWHSVLAVICAGIIGIFGIMEEKLSLRVCQLIGKHEYGIYLLHFPILQNLLQSPFIQQMNLQGHYIVGCASYLCIAVSIGLVFNQLGQTFFPRKFV